MVSADEIRKRRYLSRQSFLRILAESEEALARSRNLLARSFLDPFSRTEARQMLEKPPALNDYLNGSAVNLVGEPGRFPGHGGPTRL